MYRGTSSKTPITFAGRLIVVQYKDISNMAVMTPVTIGDWLRAWNWNQNGMADKIKKSILSPLLNSTHSLMGQCHVDVGSSLLHAFSAHYTRRIESLAGRALLFSNNHSGAPRHCNFKHCTNVQVNCMQHCLLWPCKALVLLWLAFQASRMVSLSFTNAQHRLLMGFF